MFRTILLMMTGLLMVTSAEAGPQDDCEQSRDPRRVISGCTHVLKEHPDDARVYTLRGYAYLETNEPKLAFADFDKAIALDPTYSDAYAGRGSARLGDPLDGADQAMADVNKAIELDPKNARAYYYRSDMYSAGLPDYDERVLADLSKAIELDPTNVGMLFVRGMRYALEGQRALAKADFAKALEIDANATILIGGGFPDLLAEIEAERRQKP